MTDQPQQPAKPMRRMSIKGLLPSLPERGKVKIGMLGEKRKSQAGNEWQMPVKLEHFRVTTMERGADGNFVRDEEIHEQIGDKPTEIPVRLLYDEVDLNCPTRYAAYNGRTLWCSGDGETANRLMQNGQHSQIECPCYLSDPTYSPKKNDPPKCKMNSSLSMIIDGASGLGGVWKLRTTGYNSIMALLGTMQFLRSITGGPLANIPLKLKVQPKQATNPVDGTPVKIQYVTLEFDGDMATLQKMGHAIALERATTHVSIKEIEIEARRMLSLSAPANAPLPGDDTEDVVQEFYPEQYDEAPDSWTDSPRPTRAQFQRQTEEQLAEPEQEAEHNPEDTAVELPPHTYIVSLVDGTETEPMDEVDAYGAMVKDMHARAKERGFEGLAAAWQDNSSLIDALEGDGHLQIVADLRKDYMAITSELHQKPLEKPKPQPHPAGGPPDRPRAARGATPGAIPPSPPVDASPAQQRPPATQTRPGPDVLPSASAGAPTPQGRDVSQAIVQAGDQADMIQPTRLYPEKEVMQHNRSGQQPAPEHGGANKTPPPVVEQMPKPASGGEVSPPP